MNLAVEVPRQRTTTPILVVSILLAILLFPVLEGFLDKWIGPTASPPQQNSSWDVRTM
jgi:hypothetical protein